MGACVSCALGDAPHKEGYGYGGDVVKQHARNQEFSRFDASFQPTAGEATGNAGALNALEGTPGPESTPVAIPPAAISPPSTHTSPKMPPTTAQFDVPGQQRPDQPPPLDRQQPNFPLLNNQQRRYPPNGPQQPNFQPLNGQQSQGNGTPRKPMPPNQQFPPRQQSHSPQPPAPVYAPQAQRVPPVAAFEMQGSPTTEAFDPYNEPMELEAPHGGFLRHNRASAALSIISTYDDDTPAAARGRMGGRGGMQPGRGRGGPGPRAGFGGNPSQSSANDPRPSSRQGGERRPMLPFAGDQGSDSRQRSDSRGSEFSTPYPFTNDPRPSSRQRGGGGIPPRGDSRGPGFSPPMPSENEQRKSSRGNNRPAPLFASEQRPSSRGSNRGPAPPFANDQRPSSRNAGERRPMPQFANDQRPNSRGSNRGQQPDFGPPPFAQEQRSSSRNGGGRRGPPMNRRGGPPGPGGRSPPTQQQQMQYPQQRGPQQQRSGPGPAYSMQ
ncbi:hypothetical protein BJ878DRAFT_495326 [Calycina marina]|uniref:Uncharacterized protein n=1 Tax=Calycina marina TaxID=1763456 RepID=A0A9P8CHF4_9HELO|nr:hypothetical protein BJ878DRAFT_495326 [Calycina marina]